MQSLAKEYLTQTLKRFLYYKNLADKTFAAISEEEIHFQPNAESNSIAVIVQHVVGNMLSRWTNFLTEDGEKAWRERDLEFEEQHWTKEILLQKWEQGWHCMVQVLQSLQEEDLMKTITIRTESLTVVDAINRQLAHYPYHIGQIVYVAKMIKQSNWKSLSIPKGQSNQFNQSMKKQ